MCDFFKPWRRKIGVATLVMACVFAAGWVRSFYFMDAVGFDRDDNTSETFHSDRGQIIWWESSSDFDHTEFSLSRAWTLLRHGSHRCDDGMPQFNIYTSWRFKIMGIGSGIESALRGEGRGRFIYASYWTFTVPMFLLSAWLLLSKPRMSKPIAEAVPDKKVA